MKNLKIKSLLSVMGLSILCVLGSTSRVSAVFNPEDMPKILIETPLEKIVKSINDLSPIKKLLFLQFITNIYSTCDHNITIEDTNNAINKGESVFNEMQASGESLFVAFEMAMIATGFEFSHLQFDKSTDIWNKALQSLKSDYANFDELKVLEKDLKKYLQDLESEDMLKLINDSIQKCINCSFVSPN